MNPQFFTPSGETTTGTPLIILGSALVSSILAPLYAVAILYIPWIYLNVVCVLGFGLAASFGGGIVAHLTHTRNPFLAGVLSMIGGLAGFLISWSCWAGLVIAFEGNRFPGFSELIDFLKVPEAWLYGALHPSELLDVVKEINEEGLWSLGRRSRTPVSGVFLTLVWAGEFVTYCVLAYWTAKEFAAQPYSPEARGFLPSQNLDHAGFALPEDDAQHAVVTEGIASGDLGYLAQAPVVRAGERGLFLTFHSSDLSPWGTVTITEKPSVEEKKKQKMKEAVLLKELIVPLSTIHSFKARLA
jgi:hypothetical protein